MCLLYRYRSKRLIVRDDEQRVRNHKGQQFNSNGELKKYIDLKLPNLPRERKESQKTALRQESANYSVITLEEATQLLNKDWSNIDKIKNPSEEIQLIAVQINCRAIDYINNPTK